MINYPIQVLFIKNKKMQLIFLGYLLTVCSASKTFDGFKVYRLNPTTEQHMRFISNLEREDLSLDFWAYSNNAGNPVDVMVGPPEQESFLEKLGQNGILADEMIDNVQE